MKLHAIRFAAVFVLAALLHACGGGGGSSTASGSSTGVYGVAATGAAINGSITLKDATGTTRTATISHPSGTFNIDASGLTPPYFLKAADNSGAVTLYSVASGPGNFNVNPITNLVAVSAVMSIDPLAKTPDAAFNNPSSFSSLTAAQIQVATDTVMGQMSPAFKAALAANGAGNINPLTDTFQIGNGLDRVFDNFTITFNSATGEIQERQIASNTTTTIGLVDTLGTFPAAGIYDGTVTAPDGAHVIKDILITPSGEMRYVMDNGVMVVASLSVSGNTINGSGTAYAPPQQPSFQFANGSRTISLTITGTRGNGTFSGAYTYGSYQDTFSFTLNSQQTSATSSLSKIAGTYASTTGSNTVFIGHIEANGKIWGSGPGIAYSGLISVISSNTNAYRVTLAYFNNSSFGLVSGLATFSEASLSSDSLPMPTAILPAGYTGDVANLSYIQTVAGGHGKLLMQLPSPLQQISLNAVRLDVQLQSITTRPTPDSLMIQAISNQVHIATAAGNIQYSESSPGIFITNGQTISPGSGSALNLIPNPGNIALSGPTQISIPITQAPALPALGPLPNSQLLSGQTINWTAFNITPDTEVNFTQSTGSLATLSVNSITGNTVTGTLAGSGQVSLTNNSGITTSGGTINLTGSITPTGSIASSGGAISLVGSNTSQTQ